MFTAPFKSAFMAFPVRGHLNKPLLIRPFLWASPQGAVSRGIGFAYLNNFNPQLLSDLKVLYDVAVFPEVHRKLVALISGNSFWIANNLSYSPLFQLLHLGKFPSPFSSIKERKLLQLSAFFLATCCVLTFNACFYFSYTSFSDLAKSTFSPFLNCCILSQFTSFQHFAVIMPSSFSFHVSPYPLA